MSDEVVTKHCTTCKETKCIHDFPPKKNFCHECGRKYAAKYRLKLWGPPRKIKAASEFEFGKKDKPKKLLKMLWN